MLDNFIRKNQIQLINIMLCMMMIIAEIWAMTFIGFDWLLLVIFLPFPIFMLGNVLSIFINKKNISIMVNVMKMIFPFLLLETGLMTILKIINDTRIIEVTIKEEAGFNILTIISITVSILTIILILILAFSKVEDNNFKVKKV